MAMAAARLLKDMEAALGVLAAFLLLALLAVVIVNVCLRYCFQSGFVGAEELGIWLHVAMISLGAPLVCLAILSALAILV